MVMYYMFSPATIFGMRVLIVIHLAYLITWLILNFIVVFRIILTIEIFMDCIIEIIGNILAFSLGILIVGRLNW